MRHDHGHHRPRPAEGHAHHGFDDPEAVAQRIDAAEREAWQKPEDIIASFQLPDDATAAEIGAGTGYFIVRLARHLANGTVIGLDAQPQMVAYLRQRVAELGLANVEARLVQQPVTLPLTEQLDLLLCVDTYHHIADRITVFSHYTKHLRRGGKLVIIDRAIEAPEGPPAEFRLSTETVQNELTQAGFTLVAEMDFLLPYQYYLAFTPTATT